MLFGDLSRDQLLPLCAQLRGDTTYEVDTNYLRFGGRDLPDHVLDLSWKPREESHLAGVVAGIETEETGARPRLRLDGSEG